MQLPKFSITSKKLTIFRFVCMGILNPSSFSALDTFLICSSA